MGELIGNLLRIESIFILVTGLAVFATIISIASPFLDNDTLKTRMKGVSDERDRLRAAQRAHLATSETKLRDAPRKDIASQLVEALNLRQVFGAEAARNKLRQGGFRSERHMVIFLVSRLVAPIVLGIVFFIYSATYFADSLSPNMRIVVAFAGILFGYYLPAIMLKNYINRRQLSIKRAWSDALDLMLICVESGMAIEPAMQRVALEIGASSVPLAEEMTLTIAELSYLQERRKAFENLANRTGLPTVKAVATSLIQAERYGTPIGTALRVLAQENRDARMQEAERKAAALPPKLTVPMIVFFLPVIYVVILGPAAVKVFKLE